MPLDQQLLRLAEEAEAFGRNATRVIGTEILEHVAELPLPRFVQREVRPTPKFRSRSLICEYGFILFKDDPQNLHEVRQVLQVDGKKLREPGKLKETLLGRGKGDQDKLKKALLKELERNGVKEASVDLGQMILMFQKRQLENYTFERTRTQLLGTEQASVITYDQREGDGVATVFEGKNVIRSKFHGEIFLRESDGMPLRITLEVLSHEGKVKQRYNTAVDYQLSQHGFLLPLSVQYSETAGAKVIVENRFKYSDFKIFGASSELKFTVEDPPK